MLPKTGKEARQQGLPRYFTGLLCKRGHLSERYAVDGHCVECDNKRERQESQRKATTKRYYERNKEKCMAATNRWKKSSGMAYEYTKRSRAKNPALIYFSNAKRHASKIKRTPKWLSAVDWFEIQSIYKYCSALRSIGLDYHVDHIVPLQGEIVSGFHVPWNLQVIHAEQNLAKGNKFC
jgi:5-methylcytosine-specific restriction endonuclease McrA